MLKYEIKALLSKYRNAMELVEDVEMEIEAIDKRMTSIKSKNLSGMPRGGTPVTTEDLLDEKMFLEKRKQKLEAMASEQRDFVQRVIDTLVSARQNKILTMYYVKRMTPQEIAESEHCTERTVYRFMSKGIKWLSENVEIGE